MDRQTAKISPLTSRNISKYELLTGRCFTRKDFSEKTAAIKRSEYLPLGSDLKKQISVAEKKYQGLSRFFKSDKKRRTRNN